MQALADGSVLERSPLGHSGDIQNHVLDDGLADVHGDDVGSGIDASA